MIKYIGALNEFNKMCSNIFNHPFPLGDFSQDCEMAGFHIKYIEVF
jgi:hypothetical protein